MWGIRYLAAVALASLMLVAAVNADKEDLPDPIPLRRVVLPASRVPEALKQVRDGELVQMPRNEFDALVRRAALAVKEGRDPPRLVEARYRATLTDAPSLTGSAQWKILNPSARPALLRLQGEGQTFNLAVVKPRFDNRDALLGEFPDPAATEGQPPRVLAVLVDQKGQQTLTFDWSARVEARPEGLQIDLRLPDSPAAVLELNLPADRTAAAALGDVLVSGPHPAEANDRRLWRVACGGRTEVRLLVRRSSGGQPVVLARQKTVQKLTPDAVHSETTFTVEALHQDVQEFFVEADPALRLIDVSAPNLERWEQKPGGALARLQRAARDVTLVVKGVAPLSQEAPAKGGGYRLWASPGVRLRDAVPRGEALELWVHPQLRMGSWEPGDFRLTGSSPVVDAAAAGKVTMRRLVLLGGGLAPAPKDRKPLPTRRPSALIQTGAVEFRARQASLWRIGDDGMELISRIDYQVRQGLLFQLPVRLPAGWEVESVDLTPTDGLRSSGEREDKSGRLLIVDLRRPLRAADGEGSLTLRLRPRQTGPLTGRDLAFPDVVPLGALLREGGLAIDFDEQSFRGSVKTTSPAAEPPADPLWDNVIPDYFYPYEGQSLSGALRLSPRPPRARARAWAEVHLAAGRAAMTARIQVQTEIGRTTAIDVYLAGPGDGWEWRADQAGFRVRWAEKLTHLEVAATLAGLSAHHPLGAALTQAARPAGSFWRLHFDKPLPPGRRLTLTASRMLDPSGPAARPAWVVPLPVVLGAGPFEGEATVFLRGNDHAALTGHGLRDDSAPRGAWRRLRYADASASLKVRSLAGRSPAAGEAAIEWARLTTTLAGDDLTHLFRFRLTGWTQRTVPVTLPDGAKLTAAAVDGRWLDRLPDEGVIELPVPSAAPTYELLYVTQASKGMLGARLDAAAPELPVAPASFERRWRLPADVAPLWSGRLRQLPGEGAGLTARPWQRVESLFRLGPRLPLPTERSPRPQALADALAALAGRHAGAALALGEATAELSSEYLKDAHPLLIDRSSLARAGVDRSSALSFAPGAEATGAWDAAGLEVLSARAGVVLTTRAQAQRWRREAAQGEWPAAVELALEQAARLGRDDGGRFVTALEWQAGEPAAPPAGLLGPASAREGHVGWAPLDGQPGDKALTVVRLPMMAGAGLVLAAMLVVGAFLTRRGWRAGYLIGWLALAGLALAWLPGSLADLAWWPLLAGLVAATASLLAWASRPAGTASKPTPPVAASGAALAGALFVAALFATAQPAQAQKAQPDLVFIIPGSKSGEQNVLVAPGVLTKLKTLGKPSLAPASGAVLLDALYEGKQAKTQAEFDATLNAHCLDDGPATLEVPFDGGQLTGDVLVDGAKAFPIALGGQRAGFSLTLKGKGRHKIQFKFTGAEQGEDDSAGVRQARFSVPRIVQSRLTFRTEPGASHLQLPMRHGGQKVAAEGKGLRLDADLGALAVPVVLRWLQEGKQPRPARVSFREAYLWDLAADVSTLTAHVSYEIAEGAVTSLRVDLPEGLEPRTAVARRPASGATDAAVRLSQWSVSGSGPKRSLQLDFPGPVSGAVEVTLELVPRGPWQGTAALGVPRPQGRPIEQAHLAYRVQGVEVAKRDLRRLTAARPVGFAPSWAARPAASSLAYAGTFGRDGEPSLALDLRPRLPRVEIAQDVTLRVGSRQAIWSARAEVTAAEGDLAVMQWEIRSPSPLTLTDVKGDDVRGWSQHGSRLVVWLERGTTKTTAIELAGWLPLDLPAGKPAKPAGPRLDLPCLRPIVAVDNPNKPVVRTRLTLLPEPGLSLQAQGQLNHLTRQGAAGTRPLTYVSTDLDHGGVFLVRPGPSARATIRTEAGQSARELTFASTIELQAPAEQRAFQVRVRNWPGEVWLEDGAGVERTRSAYRRVAGRREWTWSVELPAGEVKPVRLRVRGRVRLGESPDGVPMPDVSVVGVGGERVVAIDETLSAQPAVGLTPLAGREGHAWRVSEDGWSLRVAARERAAPARAVLSEHRVRLEGRRWTHEAAWLLWQDGPAALAVAWPGRGGVELLSASVDDSPLSLARIEQGKLSLPLSGPAGARRVAVHWRYNDRETLQAPDLTAPQLGGATEGPTAWTVEVPAGWEEASDGTTGAARPRAVVELSRAEARLVLARSMLNEAVGGDALAAELGRAGRSLRLAGLAIDAGAEGRGPDGAGLVEWRARLLSQSDQLRREAGAEVPEHEEDEALPDGALVSWVRAKDVQAPRARLVPASQRQTTAALAFSGQWLLLALFAAIVAATGWLRGAARRLWPEVLLLLGLAGWQAVGPTLAVVFLLALGAAGRLVLLAQGAAWLMRAAPANGARRATEA